MTPLGVSPAKERRHAHGTPAKPAPAQGTPIPILRETDILTTDPPRRVLSIFIRQK